MREREYRSTAIRGGACDRNRCFHPNQMEQVSNQKCVDESRIGRCCDNQRFNQHTVALASDLSKSIPLQQVMTAAYDFKQPISELERRLDATSFFEPTGCTFPFGTHVAVVEVDP